MKTVMAWLAMTAVAVGGTIWPVNPVTDTSLYYAQQAKLVKVDTAYVETSQGSGTYRMVLTPTVDTIMAPKTVVKIGDFTVLLPPDQVKGLKTFFKGNLATKELAPDVTVNLKWIISDEGAKK